MSSKKTTLRAVLFDLDGTLIDSNELHVDAWVAAFEAKGFRVGRGRIADEIGKGGDLLVPAVLGKDVEAEMGEAIRKARGDAYRELARSLSFFPGALELLQKVRSRGLRTAIATSGSPDDVELAERLVGAKLKDLVDVVATSEDAEVSKPAPDIVLGAAKKLGEHPLACSMVGDSIFDATSARHAGVAFLGIASGYATVEQLSNAGARHVSPSAELLGRDLDVALTSASRTLFPFDQPTAERLMDRALWSAGQALERGDLPVGAGVFSREGELLAVGQYRAIEGDEPTAHAEMEAIRTVNDRTGAAHRGCVLLSTLEPCVMCMGAAIEAGIDVVVYGLESPGDGGSLHIRPPRAANRWLPRVKGGIRRDECRGLFVEWLRRTGNHPQRDYVADLMKRTVKVADDA